MMNILISTQSEIDPILVEQLIQLPEASIYLSISQEDTLRILHEAKPSILIIDRLVTPTNQILKQLLRNEISEVYYYEKLGIEPGEFLLTRHPFDAVDGLSTPHPGKCPSGLMDEIGHKSKRSNNNHPM